MIYQVTIWTKTPVSDFNVLGGHETKLIVNAEEIEELSCGYEFKDFDEDGGYITTAIVPKEGTIITMINQPASSET
jgi:hypothetical protein